MEITETIETTKTYDLEFIITYNKDMMESDNPNQKQIELLESGEYKPQDIFSLRLSKDNLLEFLNPIHIVEMLYETDRNFNDIWKVSLCVYRNGDEDFELPKWFNECDGKIFDLQLLHNDIQQYIKK